MWTEAIPPLDDLNGLRARLTPGALRFALADPLQAEELRRALPHEGLVWLGWGRRQALLASWRPSAQERFSSMAGKDAPLLGDWLAEAFRRWRPGPDGASIQTVSWARVDRAVRLCRLEPFTERPMSLLSNGELVRACLAHGLGEHPALLVLDDLCEGLDLDGRDLLMEVATNVAAEGAAVLVLATRPSLLPWADPGAPLSAPSAAPGKGPLIFSTRGLRLDAGEIPLVHRLDWDLHGGEAWWLQGANGAGKSTLLAYLSGEHPQAWAQDWALHGSPRQAFTPLGVLRREVAWVSPELAASLGRPLEALLDEALRGPAKLLLLDEPMRGLHASEVEAWQARLHLAVSGRPERALVFIGHDAAEAPPGLNRVLRLQGHGAWVQA